MTPRERVLAAMRREDVDYPPCIPVFGEAPGAGGLTWTNDEERLDVLINHLGVDACVSLGMGPDVRPDVRERVWTEHPRDSKYPLIHKVYETPAGPLSCTVRRTEDWPHGDGFPLRSDHLSSRLVKPWVETDADMDRLECVYLPPERTDAQLEAEFGEVKDRAERWQVPMYMLVGSGLYAAYSIFGAEQAVWLSMDKPELVERLADLEHEVTLARIEIASRIGVHMVRRSSHYETTDFCNPEQVRRYMVPRFRREIELAHQHGMAMVSAACTGVMPILDVLKIWTSTVCLTSIRSWVVGCMHFYVYSRSWVAGSMYFYVYYRSWVTESMHFYAYSRSWVAGSMHFYVYSRSWVAGSMHFYVYSRSWVAGSTHFYVYSRS